jgi:UDP-hydrolysing UDP-N-acetyl-D-glucosamine 2-epimerase
VTGSIDEKVRHAVTKLADLHFVANSQAAERVIRMGEAPEAVFVTGCPSIDLAARVLAEGQNGFNPFSHGGVGYQFDISKGYLVVMQHPVTTEYKDALQQIKETLTAIEKLALPTFWFWPNVDAGSDRISKGIRIFREAHSIPFIYFFKNMSPEDFLRLLIGANCLIGNSSVGIREASYLGLPVVNIGTRQAGRDRGTNIIDTSYSAQEIIDAVHFHLANGRYPSTTLYGDGRAGQRIASLLATVPLTIEKRLTY